MPPEPYRGAVSLAASKYALPHIKAQFAAFPSAVPSPVSPVNQPAANSTIATKEQIAATANTYKESYNPDAQLAMAQNEALRAEVDKHSASFANSVSSAVTNTRQLLSLVRESIKKESTSSASELAAVENIWKELEQLFEAAKTAKHALPMFLEKQKGNMSLYHNSVINETIRDVQEELNVQHKKVNIQHSLILEHQQSFQDYKAQTDSKLKELNELQERVSRLTLDKGLLKTELDKYHQQLAQAKTGKADDVKKIEQLQKEVSTKKELAADNDTLRNTIVDLREDLKIAEQSITDKYEKEIRRVTELLGNESKKSSALEEVVKKESEQLKEYKTLQEEFKSHSAKFSKVTADLDDKIKEVKALNVDAERLQKQNDHLKERLNKLDELEKANTELSASESSRQEQVDKLRGELDAAKEESAYAKNVVESVLAKLKKTEKENADLETENNELLAKQAEHKKCSTALTILRSENTKLLCTVQELQNKPAAQTGVDAAAMLVVQKEKHTLEDKLQASNEKVADLEAALEEWTDLAKRTYKEYKEILPTYKQAEKHRQDTIEKEKEIAKLKLELTAAEAQACQSDGMGGGGNADYWRGKYESLLETLGG